MKKYKGAAGMKKNTKEEKWFWGLAGILFWIFVWQAASFFIGQELLLPSPLAVLAALAGLVVTQHFWLIVLASLGRIGLGFIMGLAAALLLGMLAAFFPAVKVLLRPMMQLVRAIPVASFIILALVWVSGRRISVLTSFLMVLPVMYNSVLTGLQAADIELLTMAQVFRVPFWRRIRAIYIPAMLPAFLSGSELALGLSWKSGVAAEIIGLAPFSIGEQLYNAKVFLLMPEMFAWTFVVIVVSWLFGKIVLKGFAMAAKKLSKGAAR